ncbi:MAG: NAD(P)H-dependent oxidoreductase [Anaerolineaceae bacterium]|nr:NAD(P)H-dependent oxidoreductase [Anaerolineaceae bacterium]
MKIIVLNGSPKGEDSITLQYVAYIRKHFPQHDFRIFHVSHRIKKMERDLEAFQEVINEVRSADGVLWSFGLWVLCVPAQYMRFIELISERGMEDAFENKYASVMTTSIHFYDHTAHNYMRAVCEDLRMKFVDAISLDIIDMMKAERRREITIFAEGFIKAIREQEVTSRFFNPLIFSDFVYQPTEPKTRVVPGNNNILVLTDANDIHTNLGKMIAQFKQSFAGEIDVINLNDIDIRGACLGCMRCGYDYSCTYKDGFADFYNQRVRSADIIVFAGIVKGRYLSSTWKTFYDRAYFWNHTPSLAGKQLGYIISGPLRQNPNLIQILEASSTARQSANHVDIITDECGNSTDLDALLQNFAKCLVSFADKGYIRPQNFLGVGGHKVFRDDIWGRLRPLWQADYRYFKKHGLFDFPQKDIKIRVLSPILMLLTRIPAVRRKYYANVKTFPAGRLKKLVEHVE